VNLMDEILREAIERGDFQDLPGQGKPLSLPDDSHTPESLRMAHKLLSDNDLVPEWMAEGQELDTLFTRLMQEVESNAGMTVLAERISEYNRRALTYNLRVPKGVVHKRMIDLKARKKRTTR